MGVLTETGGLVRLPGAFVPLMEPMSIGLSPLQAFQRLQSEPYSFFLDSALIAGGLGRFSVMGSRPFLVLRSRGNQVLLLWEDGKQEVVVGDPFEVLRGFLECYRIARLADLPLVGGAVGYFGYDLCHFIEHLPAEARDDLGLPEAYLGFYDALMAFDHRRGRAYLVSTGLPEVEPEARQLRAQRRLRELLARLQQPALPPEESPCPPVGAVRANFSRAGYLEAVERAREYIAAGDIFQVNLSQRFDVPLPFPPYQLYRRLRQCNPAPFAAYLNFPGVQVVSASPELFLRLEGDRVRTRPMKGTRPRGAEPGQDQALARELRGSIKDLAENVMIVDLMRNDIGRVCRFGTVRVPRLYTLEKYATVWQLTSTVAGRLRPGLGAVDLLRASFPGGSVTGAPKVRAMEVIDGLEPTRRGLYTGAIGYISFHGDMELNMAIRTFVVREGRAYFQVGGAVVYDSVAEAEYRETLDKARALFLALGLVPPEG